MREVFNAMGQVLKESKSAEVRGSVFNTISTCVEVCRVSNIKASFIKKEFEVRFGD